MRPISFSTLLFTTNLLLAGTAGASSAPATQPTKTLTYGEPAVIETAVLRSTGILLSADERLRGISQPDSERWQVDFSEYGPEGQTVPIVTVTPSDCGLATNLLLLTTKRVYALEVRSAACDLEKASGAAPAFDALVRFRYPEEERLREIALAPLPAALEAVKLEAPIEQLADNAARFRWAPKKGYHGPKPVLVTEDERSTYLVFPKGSWRTQDLPLFFLVNDKGERELANFDVTGTTFIVRTRFDKAVLVAGGANAGKQPYLLVSRVP